MKLRTFLATACAALLIVSCQKEAKTVVVTGITLDKTAIELTEGETANLAATVAPKDATNSRYSWSSSDATVASVSNGTVTAVKAGTATITAKTDDGGKTATCSVTVKSKVISVTGVSIDKTTLTLTEGQSEWLKETVIPENATDKSTIWTSSDASIASVTNNGKVEAVKAGEATISVTTTDGGKKAECKVTVAAKYYPVKSVTVTDSKGEKKGTLKVGETLQLKVEILPENATDKSHSWSATTDCAKVDENGLVTALKVGDCVIRVNAADNQIGEYYVSIPRINVESFKILDGEGKTEGEATVGSTIQLNAIITPEDATGKDVRWSSSASNIASVDENGLVTLKNVGTATINAVVNPSGIDRKEASYSITASAIKTTSIEVSPATLTITEGKTTVLTAKVFPESASFKTVNWSSSNTAVATVDADGKVSAIKEGKAKIYAGSKDDSGVSGFCELTVEPDKSLKGISLSSETMELKVGDEKTLTVSYKPSYAVNKNVSWSSSDNAVATVSDGKVKGVSDGSATITVTSEEGGFTATCAVTVKNTLPEGTKVFYQDTQNKLYMNGELFTNRVNVYTISGNDVYYYSYNSAAVCKNNSKLFSSAELNLINEGLRVMKVVGGKMYCYISSNDHKSARLFIKDLNSGEVRNIDFLGEQPSYLDHFHMVVTGDGTVYLAASYEDQYKEASSRMWKVKSDGTVEQTVFYTAQKSANGIYDTQVSSLCANDNDDIFTLVYRKTLSSTSGDVHCMVIFKNGTEYKTYTGYNSNKSYSICCAGNDVYAMITTYLWDCTTDIYKNSDKICQGIKPVGWSDTKVLAVDKNNGNIYYLAIDSGTGKYGVYKNGTKLYTCDNTIGHLDIMY